MIEWVFINWVFQSIIKFFLGIYARDLNDKDVPVVTDEEVIV